MRSIALLIPTLPGTPSPPEHWPIGRAALVLADEGIEVVFADRAVAGVLQGRVARPGTWEPVARRVLAAIDRFPSFSRPTAYAELLVGLGGIPIANAPGLTALLRDKVRTQAAMFGLGMPELETDARRFEAFLESGPAFLKPRFGSFGRGVRLLKPGEQPPARAVVDGVDQPMVLQRAVAPPPGWAGVALRVLVQRTPKGYRAYPPVARVHRTDPVVNRARGATVLPASELDQGLPDRARALALQVADALPEMLEIGVDAVVDADGAPHLIEVNARPRGRLAALAEQDPDRFGALHLLACCQPFRTMLSTEVAP